MKQGLSLRLGQQLTMTPALQQAIRLLQLSTVDLQQEIQELLDTNLMLERMEFGEELADEKGEEVPVADRNDNEDNLPDDLPVDAEWDDVYNGEIHSHSLSRSDDDSWWEYREANRHQSPSLNEHLMWQASITDFDETETELAAHLIDAVDDRGYLNDWDNLSTRLKQDIGCSDVALEKVLIKIQDFDPPGVAARDAAECIVLQLNQLPADTSGLDTARDIVMRGRVDLLAEQDDDHLAQEMGLDSHDVAQASALIRSLNPHPGSAYTRHEAEYVVPDVFVRKREGRWLVTLNPDITPKLRVNPRYMHLIKRADKSDDQQTIKQHLQEARYFLNSLRSRNETLLRVSQNIIEQQRAFLDYGDEAMKPLVLRDIADKLGVHESTVSRATSNKYMLTPRGMYELKYFFSSHVQTTTGGTCSATAIQAMIRRMIGEEPANKPLSDSKIATLLLEDGIQVARRTVAKYREGMDIPPSHERKQKIRH